MDVEINEFLNKEFKYRIQGWVDYNHQLEENYSDELLNRIMHTEDIITSAVKNRFPSKEDIAEKVYNYMESLL